MNSIQKWGFAFIILLRAACLSGSASEELFDYYSLENVRKFADFLYAEGDYLRAAGEYQRCLFYSSDPGARSQSTPPGEGTDSEQLRYRIALCYRLGGKTEQAIHTFETLLQVHPESTLASRAYYQIGVSYFLMEQFEQSAQFLRETLPRIADAQHHAEAQQLIGLSYLRQKQWSEAGEVFKALRESDIVPVRAKAAVYHNYAEKGAHLPTRSPFLAGIFSAIVPGAGRLYTGRVGDALNSLFIVGLTGWQAYDGFRRDGISSTKGWTFGTIGGIFYLGNIYGSVISARVYNRYVENEFLATLSVELPY